MSIKPSANSFSVHSIVVLERGVALPASWLHPGSDVIVLSELESENSDDFAQRVVRAVAGLAKSAMIAEVRLFTARDRTGDRLRARSQIARALLAAMSRAPAARITFEANQGGRAQHDLFALADTVRTEASTNVSVCLNFR